MTGCARGLHNKSFTTVQFFPGYFKEDITYETKQVLSLTLQLMPSVWSVPLLYLYFDAEIRIELMPYKNSLCCGCPMLSGVGL